MARDAERAHVTNAMLKSRYPALHVLVRSSICFLGSESVCSVCLFKAQGSEEGGGSMGVYNNVCVEQDGTHL